MLRQIVGRKVFPKEHIDSRRGESHRHHRFGVIVYENVFTATPKHKQ
jgi:hypothetical protein